MILNNLSFAGGHNNPERFCVGTSEKLGGPSVASHCFFRTDMVSFIGFSKAFSGSGPIKSGQLC